MLITDERTGKATTVTDVAPDLLETWMSSGDTLLVDVREDFEHADERIEGAVLHPLSKFDAEWLHREAGDTRVVFHCRTGKRSLEAAQRYRAGDEPVFHLAGGLEGWKAASRPVVRPVGAPRLPIMRQVQVTAGALVVLGVVLSLTLSPWFIGISAFVGCGLMFAGLSGWCGMAKLLAVMPWNRGAVPSGSAASCCSA